MAELPPSYAVASGYLEMKSDDAWRLFKDVAGWAKLFPEWIVSIEDDDDRFTATGPNREVFDLYPKDDDEHHTLDVEVVDELGSADTLKLRVLAMPGGSLVLIAHGKLAGMPNAAWSAKRDAIAQGLHALSAN